MRIATRIRLTIVLVVGLVLTSSLIAFQSAHHLRTDYAALSADVVPFIEGIERLRFLGTRSLASAVEVGFTEQIERIEKLAGEDSADEAASREHGEDEAAEFEHEAVEPFEKAVAEIGAYDLNVAGYILKPVEWSSFMEAVSRLSMYWTLIELP